MNHKIEQISDKYYKNLTVNKVKPHRLHIKIMITKSIMI